MMKIAVTTASGHLGASILKQLMEETDKERLVGIARTPSKAEHLGIEIRKGDYTNQDELEVALQGVETVLIVSGNDDPKKRVMQHQNIIEAAKVCGVRKLVYTSILGNPEKTAFSPVIKSNRQTEQDIISSGLDWVIGRNSLYIEPDLESIEAYQKDGFIANCAGDGLCGYTSRKELGRAYAKMILEERHNGKTYHLTGEAITQQQLAEIINEVYGTQLSYQAISVEQYLEERKAALGEFLGTIIGGIYEGIQNGAFDVPSDYEEAVGKPHLSALEMIQELKES